MWTIALFLALLVPHPRAQMSSAPRFMYVHRDSLKGGVDSAYRAIENDGAQICADLRCPNPYIGIESLTGPDEGWWINTRREADALARRISTHKANARVFAVRPNWSMPAPDWAADRSFWRGAPVPTRATGPSATLNAWFNHIQRDEFDSLSAMLAPDFLFVSDGSRMDGPSFVRMIKSLGISHPRVTLSNIVTHTRGNTAYVVYDRVEEFKVRDVAPSVRETGTLVLTRAGSRWLIALWTTTSPPQ